MVGSCRADKKLAMLELSMASSAMRWLPRSIARSANWSLMLLNLPAAPAAAAEQIRFVVATGLVSKLGFGNGQCLASLAGSQGSRARALVAGLAVQGAGTQQLRAHAASRNPTSTVNCWRRADAAAHSGAISFNPAELLEMAGSGSGGAGHPCPRSSSIEQTPMRRLCEPGQFHQIDAANFRVVVVR